MFCAAFTAFRANAASPADSVPPVAEWEKFYGAGEAVFQVIQTSDDGYAFIGTGWAHITYDPPILFKVDSSGNMQWNRTIRGSSLVQASDGGYVIAGGDSYDALTVFKIDSNGNSQWNQTYLAGKVVLCGPKVMVQTNDGGYAIATNNGSDYVYFDNGARSAGLFVSVLVKTDSSGRMQWDRTYKVTGNDIFAFELRSIIQTRDGGYALAGSATSNSGYTDFCLVKISSQGDLQWTKTFGGQKDDNANSLVQTTDEGYVLAGTTYSLATGNYNAWLVKIDSSGNLLWNQTYGETDWVHANSVIQTSDGGLAFAGSKPRYTEGGGSGLWLVKTDILGTMQWEQAYFQGWVAYTSDVNSLIESRDGSLVMAGSRTLSPSARGAYCLLKTEPFLPPPTPSPTIVPTLTPPFTPLNASPSTLVAILIVVAVVILAALFLVYRIRRK